MRTSRAAVVAFGLLLLAAALPAVAGAHAPSGAIFTTLSDGSEVNFNQFPSKQAVYLDGGPGPGAPQDAAGLDDGTYVFQVTDPSGKVLLSSDPAKCRMFNVSGGIITGVVVTGCQHQTGFDVDHGATTVQLFPYDDTPNNGGVYKVWVTTDEDFVLGCSQLGVANPFDVVDCGSAPGNRHGFIPSHSKTDNFKAQEGVVIEIDTYFVERGTLEPIDGLHVNWTDPLGGSNRKWSYFEPRLQVAHEAHVEAVEAGTHLIEVNDQPGCNVTDVSYAGKTQSGPSTVAVHVRNERRDWTAYIWVVCG